MDKLKLSRVLSWIKWVWRVAIWHIYRLYLILYTKLKIPEVKFFFLFLFHRYSARQFNPAHVSHNLRILFRMSKRDWLTSTKSGELLLLSSKLQKGLFSTKNILLGNALQRRVEKTIFYTYLTVTLELNNPFDRRVLEFFLEKKIALLERILGYVKEVNGKPWDQAAIRLHMQMFHRNSLLQDEIIRRMHRAVKREGTKPLVKEGQEALKKGLYPVLVSVGVSGSYWIRGTDRRIIGLFKPFDEEVHAPNNPIGPRFRGALGLRKIRRGCRIGESPHHEVAAFIVDEFFGFGIVPHTYYATFTHHNFFLARENVLSTRKAAKTKYGSFQEFLEGFASADKLSKEAHASIPLDEFQLLIVLDVIIGNADRNAGNILIGEEKVAAIDHGLCFPDTIDTFSNWYWSYFPQGKEPLFKPIVDLLHSLPLEKLAFKLNKKCFISLKALQMMKERVALFTAAIDAGLVPSQMEELFQRLYLSPLQDRDATLKGAAKEQVRLYIEDYLP